MLVLSGPPLAINDCLAISLPAGIYYVRSTAPGSLDDDTFGASGVANGSGFSCEGLLEMAAAFFSALATSTGLGGTPRASPDEAAITRKIVFICRAYQNSYQLGNEIFAYWQLSNSRWAIDGNHSPKLFSARFYCVTSRNSIACEIFTFCEEEMS